MSRLPELERALVRAARELDRTRVRRRWWKLPLLTTTVGLALAGGAVGAAELLPTGEPVPRAPSSLVSLEPGSQSLLHLRVPDPAGGLPWGVGVARSADGRLLCAQAGRVNRGALGVLGRDGAFDDDGRFHQLSPSADQSGMCGSVTSDGQIHMSSDGPPIPASAYTGSIDSAIGGCREDVAESTLSPETRRRLRDVPVCARDSLRIVKYGFAGREATRVEYSNRHVQLHVTPRTEENGAYLFVLTPDDAGGEPLALSVTYRDGTVCRGDRIPPQTDCDPPPGF